MYCPKCGYRMSDLDVECLRCKRVEENPTATLAPTAHRSGPGTENTLVKLLLYLAAPSLLLVVGALTPWIGLGSLASTGGPFTSWIGFSSLAVGDGSEFTSWRWGIWVLVAAVAALWLCSAAHFMNKGELHRIVGGVAVFALSIVVGSFAFITFFIGIAGVQYGLYLCLLGAIALVVAVVRLYYTPTPREIMIAVLPVLLALVIGISIGVKDGAPLREAKKQYEESSRKLKQMGVNLPSAPSFGPTAAGPQMPDIPKPNVTVQINQYWVAQQLGNGFSQHTADAGKKYLVVNITVTNNDARRRYISERDISMVGSDRNVYNAETMISDTQVNSLNAELLQGGSATGDVVFEVASAAQIVSVEYSSMF